MNRSKFIGTIANPPIETSDVPPRSHGSQRAATDWFASLLFLSASLAVLIPVVHFVALLAFWQMLVGSAVSLRGRLGMALGSLSFLLAGYPYPGETVYWVPGGVEYQLPVSLALLFLATVCFTTRVPLRSSRAWPRALALGLLGFIVTGFHELVALALLGVLVTGTLFVLVERRPNPGIWLVLLVFVAVGTAVSVLAPGNAERGAIDFPHGRSVSYGIIALARLLMRILRWIDLKLVVASVLLTLTFGSQLRSSQQDPSDRTRMRKWGFPLAGASILLGICAALTYVTGGLGPERSHNLLYMTFCIAWFTSLVTVLKNARGLPYWRIRSSVRPLRNVAAAFFCVSLIGSMNHGIGTRDLLFYAVLQPMSPFLRSLLQPRSGGTWTSDLTQISQSISSLRSTSGSDRFVCKTSPRPWTRADRRGGEVMTQTVAVRCSQFAALAMAGKRCRAAAGQAAV